MKAASLLTTAVLFALSPGTLPAATLPSSQPARVDAAGDPLPEGAFARLGTLRHRAGFVGFARFSPDGKTIQTISADGYILREWDAANGALRHTRVIVKDMPKNAAMTPDCSAYLVIDTKALRLVSTATGKTLAHWEYPGYTMLSVKAVSRDGKRFLLYGSREARDDEAVLGRYFLAVCDVNVPVMRLINGMPGQVNDLQLSPDNQRLIVVCQIDRGGEVACRDLASGRTLWRVQRRGLEFAPTLFSPDGRTLMVRLSGDQGHWIEAWDADSGKPRPGWQAHTEYYLQPRAFSPDGRLLVCADWNGGLVLDAQTGKKRYTLSCKPYLVAFSPDGKSFLTAGSILQHWDAATGKPLWADTTAHGHFREVWSLAFSPNGKQLASTDGLSLLIWDVSTRKSSHVEGIWTSSFTFAPDGKLLYVIENRGYRASEVIALATDSGKPMMRYKVAGLFEPGMTSPLSQVRLTPDGKVAALAYVATESVYEFHAVVSWDLHSGKNLAPQSPFKLPDSMYHGLRLAPDGRTILALDQVFDTATRATRTLQLQDGEDCAVVCFTPNATRAAGYLHRRTKTRDYSEQQELAIGVWDLASGRLLARLPLKNVVNMRLMPDGKALVVLHTDRLALWDIATGKETLSRPAPPLDGPWAGALAVSADGRVVATAHEQGSILLWDVSQKPSR